MQQVCGRAPIMALMILTMATIARAGEVFYEDFNAKPLTGWKLERGGAVTASNARVGEHCLTAAGNGETFQYVAFRDPINVRPGERFGLSCSHRITEKSEAGTPLLMALFEDDSGKFITSVNLRLGHRSAWHFEAATFEVPPNASRMIIAVRLAGVPAPHMLSVDGIRLVRIESEDDFHIRHFSTSFKDWDPRDPLAERFRFQNGGELLRDAEAAYADAACAVARGDNTVFQYPLWVSHITVQGGARYEAAAHYRTTEGLNGRNAAMLIYFFHDENGKPIADERLHFPGVQQWTEAKRVIIAPENAVRMDIGFRLLDVSPQDMVYLDNLRFAPAPAGATGEAASARPTASRGAAHDKTHSRMVTAGMRENAIRNIERYDWARQRRDELIDYVTPFMELPAEKLWRLLPSQEMGRDRQVYRHGLGSPQEFINHGGKQVGEGAWNINLLGRPWQLQCNRTGIWYPMNDFASYYESSLDETGRFRAGAGDPQYLQPREGVEGEARRWIDDGNGVEYKGYQWYFAARYAETMWRTLTAVAEAMGVLYTMTGDPAYARRAAIILDRMADFYPEMDETPHRRRGMHTSYGPGRVMGLSWEAGCIHLPVALTYDYIYDAIKDDTELVDFLDRMGRQYRGSDKSTFAAIDRNLRENLLIEIAEEIISRGPSESRGAYESAITALATSLDDSALTPAYLDWLFAANGGRLPFFLVDWMNRDGFNNDSGMGYIEITGKEMYTLGMILRRYGHAGYDLFDNFPNLRNAFTMGKRVRVLDATNPMVGDGGSSMEMAARLRLPADMLLDGYKIYRTPDIAAELYHVLDGDLGALPPRSVLDRGRLWAGHTPVSHVTDIYEPYPEAVLDELRGEFARLASQQPAFESYNSGGFGFAALQAPSRNHPRAAGMNYGRIGHPAHPHYDRLGLHLWAFGEVLMPDVGYPLYTGDWPEYRGFTQHTASHNTVMVNDTRQGRSYSGKTLLFADAGPLRLVDVDGLGADPKAAQTGRWDQQVYENVTTYRRVVVMIDIDEADSYLLDLFWVRGGESHRLIQNGGGTWADAPGLSLTAQSGGTMAGADVAFAEAYDGPLVVEYAGTGFQFFENVHRDDNPSEAFYIDWPIDPRYEKPPGWKAHLRVHNLTPVQEVVLADGLPSRGHPTRIRYCFRNRFGNNLQSQFVSVIEPYQGEPFIDSVRVVERRERAGAPFAAAVEVRLRDGQRDVILVNEEAGRWQAEGVGIDGRVGMVRFDAGGEPQMLAAVAAKEVWTAQRQLRQSPGFHTGRLVGYDDSDPQNVRVKVSAALDADVVGRYIIFDNPKGMADASYRIEAVESPTLLNLGATPLFEKLANPTDFSKGVVYSIRQDDAFIIPRTAVWRRGD